jgi:hypothetical protein
VALYSEPPICGNTDDDQHQDCVTEPFDGKWRAARVASVPPSSLAFLCGSGPNDSWY